MKTARCPDVQAPVTEEHEGRRRPDEDPLPPDHVRLAMPCEALVGVLVVRELRAYANRCDPALATALRGARVSARATSRTSPQGWVGVDIVCDRLLARRAADVIRERAEWSGRALFDAMRGARVEAGS